MFATVVIVLSQAAIPMPSGVPITLQTFAGALCEYMLGAKYGIGAIGVTSGFVFYSSNSIATALTGDPSQPFRCNGKAANRIEEKSILSK